MSNPETHHYRRIKEYAADRKVSVRTVYNWRDRHGLRISHVVGIPVIFDDDDAAFMAQFREPAAA